MIRIVRSRAKINDACRGVETLGWQGARSAHTHRYVSDEQRGKTRWIGVQNVPVIFARRLSLAAVLLSASSAGAIDRLTLEAGLGVAAPLNTFFNLRDKNGNDIFTAKTKLGPSLAVSLLLNDIELRWGMNVYRISNVESEYVSDKEIDGVLDVVNVAGLCTAVDCEAARQTLQTPDSGFIFVNSLTAGYRFYFSRGDFRPYFPLGVGSVVVGGESASIDRFLFGFGAQSGLGMEATLEDDWAWFLSIRYHISLVEAPTSVAASGLIAEQNAFESTTVLFHAVGLNTGVLTGW